ncbi:hypothetical protein PMAYCL1PPCAC_04421, partial [Pristionchus mayeri]
VKKILLFIFFLSIPDTGVNASNPPTPVKINLPAFERRVLGHPIFRDAIHKIDNLYMLDEEKLRDYEKLWAAVSYNLELCKFKAEIAGEDPLICKTQPLSTKK